MKFYVALIDHERGSAFGIRFPDLPGVFAAADSEGDVLKAASEALTFYAESERLPKPRDVSEIRAEVADDLAEGAVMLMVPYIVRRKTVKRVNVSLDRGTLAAIDAEAERRKQTRSAFLSDAALAELAGKH